MTEPRRPAHLAVLVGVSAGAYAVSLAGVTALQSAADAELHADREPIRLAAAAAAAEHASLESALDDAAHRYAVLADRYHRSGLDIEGIEAALDALAARAAAVSESAASLPTRFALPAVRSAPRIVSAPATHATTRASG
jgi:hypothetical protein